MAEPSDRAPLDTEAFLADWFGDTREDPDRVPERLSWWFGEDDSNGGGDRDGRLRSRWGEACERALAGGLDGLADTPRGRLALVLLLDQLPRNLFRGTARAFAGDEMALHWCLDAHRRSFDDALKPVERVFLWMPLQHAEDLERQELGIRLFRSLAAEDPQRDELWSRFAEFAERHHDIIQRFGRFPHRNDALNRPSTDREQAWLADGGETFGQ